MTTPITVRPKPSTDYGTAMQMPDHHDGPEGAAFIAWATDHGLCDWCGTRSPEQLAANPAAMFHAVTGELLGLGGSGQAHIDSTRRPDACWMPNSGRTLAAR